MSYLPKEPAELIGFLLGKTAAACLMAYIITTYSVPFWLAAVLIFLV
jgi:hypothetical protein